MYNSRRSGTAEAAELLHSAACRISLPYARKNWEQREVHGNYTRGLGIGGKHPTALPCKKRVKALPPPPPILCRIQVPEGLASPALHFGFSEVCLTFMNCKCFRSILIHCTPPTEQERKGREKNEVIIAKPSLSIPSCIIPHLP